MPATQSLPELSRVIDWSAVQSTRFVERKIEDARGRLMDIHYTRLPFTEAASAFRKLRVILRDLDEYREAEANAQIKRVESQLDILRREIIFLRGKLNKRKRK